MLNCSANNEGSQGAVISVTSSEFRALGGIFQGGNVGIQAFSSVLCLSSALVRLSVFIELGQCDLNTQISNNSEYGMLLTSCDTFLESCRISSNDRSGIRLERSTLFMSGCSFARNNEGSMMLDADDSDSIIRCHDCSSEDGILERFQTVDDRLWDRLRARKEQDEIVYLGAADKKPELALNHF